jgi:hypothetical protein
MSDVMPETQTVIEQKTAMEKMVESVPAPVRKLFSDSLTDDVELIENREKVKNIMQKLQGGENLTDEESTVYISKYRVGAISFENMWNNNDIGLDDEQKRELASLLLSGYMGISDNFWAGARKQNSDYVIIDTEKDGDTAVSRAEYFCRELATKIIKKFVKEKKGNDLNDVDVEDYLMIGIGKKLDGSDEGGGDAKLPVRFSTIRDNEGKIIRVEVSQNFAATEQAIFAPVALHGEDLLEEFKKKKAEDGDILPILMSPEEDEEVDMVAKIGSKRVEKQVKFVRNSGMDLMKPEIGGVKVSAEVLNFLAKYVAAESFFTPEYILKLVEEAGKADDLGQKYVHVDLGQMMEDEQQVNRVDPMVTKMAPDTGPVSVSLGENAGGMGVDLSGMSLISRMIESGSYDKEKWTDRVLYAGFEQFMAKWQDGVAQIMAQDNYFSDERGGDGIKGIRVGDADNENISGQVDRALILSTLWRDMMGEVEDGESGVGGDIKSFVGFIREQEVAGQLTGVLMKSALIQTETNLDIHPCGFVELTSKESIDTYLTAVKYHLQQVGVHEAVIAVNDKVAELLRDSDDKYVVERMGDKYPDKSEFVEVYLVERKVNLRIRQRV